MGNAEARLEVLTRINRAVAGVQAPALPAYPQCERLEREAMLRQFQDRIEDYRASFQRVAQTEVAGAVALALAGAERVVVPAGLNPAFLPTGLHELHDDPPLSHAGLDRAEAVVTGCAVAISETGTIILDHGVDQGRRALTLIPDLHICVIRAEQIVQSVLDGVQRMEGSVGAGRPLTWISGGSATSDIELVRVEGVHGPRRLCVVVLD
ncbi:LutC/YkgG family protein [Deinococcus humi]|uniref:L-lactate dehydrogenase complex protein LldG n=1 Tax=Deinococcus humi TaxID=662880 RepID=A0A7W8JYD0_9DEIO|nr:lactate utilization protein C [Deinococcus humi]MBB5365465.1 L-lactate dehydrogenase complex protein LldG [Deinococcus humi]GGO37363.1 lactate utilization protein C [Deinococcus humi]